MSSGLADCLLLFPAVAHGRHVGTREHRPSRAAPHQHRTQRDPSARPCGWTPEKPWFHRRRA